ncbi:hypothetical protein [Bacillus toyonensis]|uniref:hypothetical protein n=1 Tax=Bacillus toyonensis TaxID=155322 RepID=UPI000BF0ED45|nr:hypothetical protein [Bacillus toyonensis]PEL24305.1 hypothetical protein CN624_18070 [Bacillus toyonensis]
MYQDKDTVEVGFVFMDDAPKIHRGYIKNGKPLDIQLEERFIPIQIHGMWKHVSTRRINEIWETNKRHLI